MPLPPPPPQVTSRRPAARLTVTSTDVTLRAAELRPTSRQKPTTLWYPAVTVTRIFDWPTAVKRLDGTTAQTIFCFGGSETFDADLPKPLERGKRGTSLCLFPPDRTPHPMGFSSSASFSVSLCILWLSDPNGTSSPIIAHVTFVSSSCL